MRTVGAKDLKKRKERKDKKHRYINRNGHMVRYVSNRGRNAPIKLYFMHKRRMSPDAISRWSAHLRPIIKKDVWIFGPRIDVDPEQISTPERIVALAEEHLYEGVWIMLGCSRGRTRTHTKWVKLCRITIRETPDGLRATTSETNRLSRYWFWRGS